jgi:CheY-like chemotaxis protein
MISSQAQRGDTNAEDPAGIIEDNEMNRDMLARRLTRRGYDVVIAVDGAEGVAKARSDAPDLILMDMHLPIMDGWEATRRLKAAPETQAIPIIGLTVHAMSGDREKVMAAGADDYDIKPISRSSIRCACGSSNSPRASSR